MLAKTAIILNAVCKARFTHMCETCKTTISINRFINVLSFYTSTLNVKNTKTINCKRFFDNYISQKHTQSSSFRSVYEVIQPSGSTHCSGIPYLHCVSFNINFNETTLGILLCTLLASFTKFNFKISKSIIIW